MQHQNHYQYNNDRCSDSILSSLLSLSELLSSKQASISYHHHHPLTTVKCHQYYCYYCIYIIIIIIIIFIIIITIYKHKLNIMILFFSRDKQALNDWRDKTRKIRQQKQHLAKYKKPLKGESSFIQCTSQIE